MTDTTQADARVSALGNAGSAARSEARPRVALLCDLIEEEWPSMALTGDMLASHLDREQAATVHTTQIRPAMVRRAAHLPLLPRRLAHNADRLANRFVDYPRHVRRISKEYDLFHIVDHSYSQLAHALPMGRVVVTCHDIDTFRAVLEPARTRRGMLFRAMTQRVLDGFIKAARVACISEATRVELLSLGVVSAGRAVVIPLGAHPLCTPWPDREADAAAARLLGPQRDDAPELLHVGSTIARKRVDVLLKTFAAVRAERPTARLVRVGGAFTGEQRSLVRALAIDDAVTVLPPLEYSVLAAVYRRAALVLQPSEREGFGLPVAEAMACGTHVVAADIPAMREIGGEAIDYCAVGDVAEWHGRVVARIDERRAEPERWQARRTAGLHRAARYTWSECARSMARVYREVLDA
jgi:glycosyltransferase involved in cell wall biosynthesis